MNEIYIPHGKIQKKKKNHVTANIVTEVTAQNLCIKLPITMSVTLHMLSLYVHCLCRE
jgi:hypothetical protein